MFLAFRVAFAGRSTHERPVTVTERFNLGGLWGGSETVTSKQRITEPSNHAAALLLSHRYRRVHGEFIMAAAEVDRANVTAPCRRRPTLF